MIVFIGFLGMSFWCAFVVQRECICFLRSFFLVWDLNWIIFCCPFLHEITFPVLVGPVGQGSFPNCVDCLDLSLLFWWNVKKSGSLLSDLVLLPSARALFFLISDILVPLNWNSVLEMSPQCGELAGLFWEYGTCISPFHLPVGTHILAHCEGVKKLV